MQAKLLLTSFLVMSVVEQQTVNANTEDSLEIWDFSVSKQKVPGPDGFPDDLTSKEEKSLGPQELPQKLDGIENSTQRVQPAPP